MLNWIGAGVMGSRLRERSLLDYHCSRVPVTARHLGWCHGSHTQPQAYFRREGRPAGTVSQTTSNKETAWHSST